MSEIVPTNYTYCLDLKEDPARGLQAPTTAVYSDGIIRLYPTLRDQLLVRSRALYASANQYWDTQIRSLRRENSDYNQLQKVYADSDSAKEPQEFQESFISALGGHLNEAGTLIDGYISAKGAPYAIRWTYSRRWTGGELEWQISSASVTAWFTDGTSCSKKVV
jgi:hypothetical protein